MTSEIKRVETAAEKAVIGHFDAMPGDDPMHEIRASAFDVIRQAGLPHRRVEDWKYTDLRTLLQDVPAPAAPGDVEKARAILAERLAAVSPGDLNRVVFGASGGEAIDMAIKIPYYVFQLPWIYPVFNIRI